MKNVYVKVVLCAQNGTIPKDKHKVDCRLLSAPGSSKHCNIEDEIEFSIN
jgi:hypothetical protein